MLILRVQIRIFLITAKYCTYAVWRDDRQRIIDRMRENGLFSLSDLGEYFVCWWYVGFRLLLYFPSDITSRRFEKMYRTLILVETWMDLQAYNVKTLAWIRGLWTMGFEGAHKAAAGLA